MQKTEGVLICKKDILPNSMHPHIKYPVPNLHVIQLMRGFKTKGYVKEQFNWMHYYWYVFFLCNILCYMCENRMGC